MTVTALGVINPPFGLLQMRLISDDRDELVRKAQAWANDFAAYSAHCSKPYERGDGRWETFATRATRL